MSFDGLYEHLILLSIFTNKNPVKVLQPTIKLDIFQWSVGSHAGVVVGVMVVVVVSGSAVDSFSSVPPSSSAGTASSVVPSSSSAIRTFSFSFFAEC